MPTASNTDTCGTTGNSTSWTFPIAAFTYAISIADTGDITGDREDLDGNVTLVRIAQPELHSYRVSRRNTDW